MTCIVCRLCGKIVPLGEVWTGGVKRGEGREGGREGNARAEGCENLNGRRPERQESMSKVKGIEWEKGGCDGRCMHGLALVLRQCRGFQSTREAMAVRKREASRPVIVSRRVQRRNS